MSFGNLDQRRYGLVFRALADSKDGLLLHIRIRIVALDGLAKNFERALTGFLANPEKSLFLQLVIAVAFGDAD